eukprot:2070350-Rhodomonas_salina.2
MAGIVGSMHYAPKCHRRSVGAVQKSERPCACGGQDCLQPPLINSISGFDEADGRSSPRSRTLPPSRPLPAFHATTFHSRLSLSLALNSGTATSMETMLTWRGRAEGLRGLGKGGTQERRGGSCAK